MKSNPYAKDIRIEVATEQHYDDMERLAATHQDELGFVAWGALRKALEAKNVFVAIMFGKVIGFLSHYTRKKDNSETLQYIAVEPAYRGVGAGRALINAFVDDCRAKKRTAVALRCKHTLDSNGFYERLGFRLESCVFGGKNFRNTWVLSL